eukprot:2168528-Pyramimonas_sp.AAC.1
MLYSKEFNVVVSADEGGNVMTWDLKDGSKTGRFTVTQGSQQSKITAIAFDNNERRLLVGIPFAPHQSDAGNVGIFSRGTNRTQEA